MTLVSLPGYEEMRDRMDEDGEQRLLDTLGTYLKANSVGGDMASRIGDGKFGLVHDSSVDVKEVEKKITEFSKEADPTGQGVEVEATAKTTFSLPSHSIRTSPWHSAGPTS